MTNRYDIELYYVASCFYSPHKVPELIHKIPPDRIEDRNLRTIYQTIIASTFDGLGQQELFAKINEDLEEDVNSGEYKNTLSNLISADHNIYYAEREMRKAIAITEFEKINKFIRDVIFTYSDDGNVTKRNVSQLKGMVDQLHSGQDTSNIKNVKGSEAVVSLANIARARLDGTGAAINQPIPIGIPIFDSSFKCLMRGEMLTLGARPGVGKSAIAVNIADHVALKEKIPTMIFSLEMTAEQYVDRQNMMRGGKSILSGDINHDDIARLAKIEVAMNQEEVNYTINDDSYMTPSKIISLIECWVSAGGKNGLVIIDYLQLVREEVPGKMTKNEFYGMFTADLKAIAKRHNIAILLLSQLNRNIENRDDPTPMLSDLRDSGGIEQNSAGVMFLSFCSHADQITDGIANAILTIAKWRHGHPGTIELEFHKKRVLFKQKTITGEHNE